MMIWNHVKVARFRGVMRSLLGDIVGSGIIWEVPIAGEDLAQNGIQGLLDTRWADVPPRQVEFHD